MRRWYPVAVIVAAFAASIAVYGRLPEPMPIHWDLHGRVDGYGSRPVGAFGMPVLLIGMALLIPVLPKIDPRDANYGKFLPTYHLVMNATLTLMLGIHVVVLASAMGARVPIDRVVTAGLGALMLVIGNVLPRARPNWMFGIRTPWTLSNDRVWTRTHRVGGYIGAAAGVVLLLAAGIAPPVAMVGLVPIVLALTGLASVIYSYIVWRQETRS